MSSATEDPDSLNNFCCVKLKVLGIISSYIGFVSFSYDGKQFMNSFSLCIDKNSTATKK